MALSWNEIKTRAAAFVNEWKDKAPTAREEADAQTFETGFFRVFGVERSQVAIFEQKVRLSGEANGYIDLFWKGHIMIEMKSPGKDMSKAFEQAKNYANALKPADLPKGILICDFNRFHYYDLLDNAKRHEFALSELVQYVELFGDLAGYKDVEYKKQDAVNIEAAEKMGRLHDRLKEIGYAGHQLEVYLVRILFCLFADDTGIFEHDSFIKYILQRTNEDGSDLALHLQKIFEVLNKPQDKRLKTIDEQLDKFPYVNGGLFEETLEIADFDSGMREAIVECCTLDWGKISPAIFGSMFQSVMNEKERRNLGAHYTSEENILKLIHPLFLDDLWAEFDKYKALKSDVRIARLNEFHEKLARLKFLDPACGCGNFLIITYREIRILELSVIKELLGGERILDVDTYVKVNVNQFYGIEIEEFPSKIAQVAMWLMDHQMNMLVRDMFGEYYVRIPLRASPSIVCANSLRTDWESVVPKNELSYILGNPPFVGFYLMNESQKEDMSMIFEGDKNTGVLDFVTAWYKKAAEYIQGTDIEVSFVSTNSICQGESVAPLWNLLFNKYGIKINFAHQTFRWNNEARGKAAVFCVIVGFGLKDRKSKKLYHYIDVDSEPIESSASQINAYLVDAPNVIVESRSSPLCSVPAMVYGNKPVDGGSLILSEEEKNGLVKNEPGAEKYIRRLLGAEEYINNIPRFCLWLIDANPSELKALPYVLKRIESVKAFRLASKKEATRKWAAFPSRFVEVRQPDSDYVIVPCHSSENRKYVPIGFVDRNVVVNDAVQIIPDGTLCHFGILTSTMHMAWMRYVCGRLEMRYRYSASIVYNNFPWPNPSDKQKSDIEEAAQGVLDARAKFPDSSLADLYDPDLMPPDLVKAHAKLDRLVEKAYGKSFSDDAERVAFLFEEYRKLTEGLFAKKAK
ncbi:MAG TPA: N-6 DNA methylase [Treponemataceae bacterium]|nr:N-6 DNA methylase [Treponemataceae bacterium]